MRGEGQRKKKGRGREEGKRERNKRGKVTEIRGEE